MAIRGVDEIAAWLCAAAIRVLETRAGEITPRSRLDTLEMSSLETAAILSELADWLGRPVKNPRLEPAATIADLAASLVGEPFAEYVNPFLARQLRRLEADKRFVRGEGCTLWDDEGRRYLDFLAQYGAVPFGHNPPEIWAALRDVGERAEPSLVQPSILGAAGELAQRLISLAPDGLRYVTFVNSGAEAAEVALKLCRNATGRRRVLSTQGAFHGKTLAALSASGRSPYQAPFGLPSSSYVHIPYGDLDALRSALAAPNVDLAAFIVEPIQGEGGVVEPPPGYLRAAQALCREAGVPLVVDEVQTGLGRTGALFACLEDCVAPDVLMLSKALGGGLIPIGAVLCRSELYHEEFAATHSSTFAGNALAARVGLAALDVLTRDEGTLLARVARNGARLKSRLEEMQARFPELVSGVRGRGFLLGLCLQVPEERRSDSYLALAAQQRTLTQLLAGYLLNVESLRVAPTLLNEAVLRIEPPLIATEAECDRAASAIERALEALRADSTGRFYGSILDRAPRASRPGARAAPRERWPEPAEGDGRFAFLMNVSDTQSYVEFDPTLGELERGELDRFVEAMDGTVSAFRGSSVRVVSASGAAAYGDFIVVARTARGLMELPHERALAEVRDALSLARARGAQLVGLGGFTSVVSRGGFKLRHEGIPLTSGNAYTVVAAIEALTLVQRWLGRELRKEIAAVVGGAGSVGRGAAVLLASEVERLILVGNPLRGDAQVRKQLLESAANLARQFARERELGRRFEAGSLAERITSSPALPPSCAPLAAFRPVVQQLGDALVLTGRHDALRFADVVVSAVSHPGAIFDPADFKSGALVCDLSRPRSVSEQTAAVRSDVLCVDGGVIEVPGRPFIGRYGLGPGLSYACMAETMMLTLERRFAHSNVGAALGLGAILEQRALAGKHGFQVAQPQSFGRSLSRRDVEHWRARQQGAGRRGTTTRARMEEPC